MKPHFILLLCAANCIIGIIIWTGIAAFYKKLPTNRRKPYGIMMFNFLWPKMEKEMNELNWKLPKRALYLWISANVFLSIVLLIMTTK